MPETSILALIQQTVSDRLLSDPYFSDIPVVTEMLGDIENQIQIAIGQIGVVVIVATPNANAHWGDSPGPYFDNIRLVIRVCENVIVNQSATGTQKRSIAIAEHAATLIHLFIPPGTSSTFAADTPTISLQPDPTGLVVYDVQLKTEGGLSYEIPVLSPVTSSVSGAHTLTLACATAGAAIFYTLDGSYPSPRKTFYVGPVTGTTGQTLRAQAWLSGYVNSPILTTTVP